MLHKSESEDVNYDNMSWMQHKLIVLVKEELSCLYANTYVDKQEGHQGP